ncbi:uncharacterized protein EI90DRAFT_2902635, partial [Cantharellus anzutake]|uniref:uncharacterized protein n=1 Tax=Cantharellus anzutake TaxID=1750568 RepID=UPI001906EEF3
SSERILWTMEPEHDERVTYLLDWIDRKAWSLAKFGMEKFLKTKKRGAVVSNAGYVSRSHPEDPVFDWLPFDQAQRTHDRTLQESIASYDPTTTTVVFVFLVSNSYSSMAIWRKLLTIPPSIQLRMNVPLEKLKRELLKTTNIIQIKCGGYRNFVKFGNCITDSDTFCLLQIACIVDGTDS